jgi:hypothetical protein
MKSLRIFAETLMALGLIGARRNLSEYAEAEGNRVEIRNKRASFDYEFLETYEAGIVLVGTEIKSIRVGRPRWRILSAIS